MKDGGQVIFEGDDIAVCTELEGTRSDAVITFTSRRLNPKRDRAGFGVEFFRKRGIPAVHVISFRNHWWQVAEMDAAIAAINALNLKGRYSSITTYGSSMGAHGALVFSDAMKADRVLAFSPQFALHGRDSAWNAVWARETAGMVERYRFEDGCSTTADILVCIDPRFATDMAHVRAMQRHRPIQLIRIPFGQHPPMKYLQDGHLLTPLVDSVLAGSFDMATFMAQLRANRRNNLRYVLGMARAHQRRPSRIGRCLLDRGIEEIRERLDQGGRFPTPGDAAQLIELGCPPETALPLLDALAKSYPDDPSILTARSRFLLSTNPAEALVAAKLALKLNRKNVDLRLQVVHAQFALGLVQEAREGLATALSLQERNPSVWKRFLVRCNGQLDNDQRAAILARLN